MKSYSPIRAAERASNRRRERPYCHKGHDLANPESYVVVMMPNGREFKRCRRCQAQKGLTPQGRKMRCVRGHDLTAPGATYQDRRCRACQQEMSRNRQRSKPANKRSRVDIQTHEARAREMLGLVMLRERCATHWERAEIDARYAELLRLNTGGEDE